MSEQDLQSQVELLEKRLEEAHKMASLGRLLSGIVHEINTPIGSILSNNEVIIRSIDVLRKQVDAVEVPKKVNDILAMMQSLASVDKIACERISAMIRSLKTFSRVDEGDIRKVDVHSLLNTTLKLAVGEFRRRVKVVTDYAELPEIECFPQSLNQVFLNLLVNAGQAIEGEGTVTVRTRQENDLVVVAIVDTGRGIPDSARGKIFSPGFTTKPVGEGTGLGLKISREIVVDMHGGDIYFESQPGVGTTFFVKLPIEHKKRS